MKRILAVLAMAAGIFALVAAPAQADHTKGKKYRNLELTSETAEERGDMFGGFPGEGSGEGAMYLNHGQERFCLFLEFELPEDVDIVALHLHEKNPGEQNGPIVIDAGDLLVDENDMQKSNPDTGNQISDGCVSGDREFLRGVLSEPDEYYVNAHTNVDNPETAFPGLSVLRTEIGRK